MADLRAETRGIIAEYQAQAAQHTADVLQVLWSQVPIKEGGATLVRVARRQAETASFTFAAAEQQNHAGGERAAAE